jgi:hypothetical protein
MNKTKQEILKLKHILANRVSSSVAITTAKINATFSVKAKGVLLKLFVRIGAAIRLNITQHRIRVILLFINRCKHLYRHRGAKGLVNYLKASQVLLQQSLGGMVLSDTAELKCRVSRNNAGLPRIISPEDRSLIRRENTKIMKYIMTLLALFRVIEFAGSLKLKTITDGFKGSMLPGTTYWRVVAYVPIFAKMLMHLGRENKIAPLQGRGINPRPIIKSAPGTALRQVSTAPLALLLTARGLFKTGLNHQLEYFIKYFEKGTKVPFPGLLRVFQEAAQVPLDLMPSMILTSLGRLGFKDEAAGKVRVFAMCDAWTQWALEPLHLWLFDLLDKIPMDGTFDQMRPVLEKSKTGTCAYSLDLSAATDRLPMSIQIKLVGALVSSEFALNWAALLVGRDYSANTKKYGGINEVLRYAVGQPMGALSSWAMLAVTHHLLVQAAAFLAGVVPAGVWFKEYAVLGDDLVIFDPAVKRQYLLIVDALGVECGIAKSILSSKGTAIEFAKRTLYKGVDISPIPITEFLSANYYLADAIAFSRKYNMTFSGLLKALGYGLSVRSNLQVHVGRLNSRVRALMFAYYLPEDSKGVEALLMRGNPYLSTAQLKEVIMAFKSYVMDKYSARIAARVKAYPSTPSLIKEITESAVSVVLNRLNYSEFLTTFTSVIEPNSGNTAVSTEVDPFVWGFD